MEVQLIRNATLRIRYAGQMILIDPDLAPKHHRPSFTGHSANPMVDLPFPPGEVAAGVDLLLVSHLHQDHFDAVEVLPRDLPILCQPGDEAAIREKGFGAVTPLDGSADWRGVRISRTGGQHGTGEVGQWMGNVSGFVLEAPGEPTLYWAGDTIWCEPVREALGRFRPDVVITHSCGARWLDATGVRQLIVMDAEQTLAVCAAAPHATVVATHMEALDHATVSRADLRAAAEAQDLPAARLRIPDDGSVVSFER
ncbi:MAG TPA: MBL fold metallo-hydrolase [Roseiflexaceae bacterium]|nr:MBL fold metallo-hydrolase [Roseiflexaceae bacterium]